MTSQSTHMPKQPKVNPEIAVLAEQVSALKEDVLRSQADYQNLLRRTQEERSKLIKLASASLVEDLVQPLDHLSMAVEQINDPGLEMVHKQFWSVLEQHGLAEIAVLGKTFDPRLMEVVEKNGDSDVVTKVVTRGYTLNGEVIRHAKVIVGETTTQT